jgi:TRAP transporter T-component
MKMLIRCAAVCSALLLSTGCSIKRVAINKLGNALASGGSTFTSDDDPELVEAAIPFGLKTYESLLAESPKHAGLLLAAAQGFRRQAGAKEGHAQRQLLHEDHRARNSGGACQARHHGDTRQQRHQGNGCDRQPFFPTREDAPDARHLALPLPLAAPAPLELFVESLPAALVPSAFARGLAGCWIRYSSRSRCTSSKYLRPRLRFLRPFLGQVPSLLHQNPHGQAIDQSRRRPFAVNESVPEPSADHRCRLAATGRNSNETILDRQFGHLLLIFIR